MTATAPPCPPERSATRSPSAIVGLALAIRLALLFLPTGTYEDFYITLRYAYNIAHGLGFVYNPGQPVLGTTTPLYTLILAGFIRLGLNPILFGKLINIAADGLACVCIYRLGRAARAEAAGLAAAFLYATTPLNLIWAVTGMESGLVAAAAIAAWAAWAERRELLAWLAAAILLLLRVDGAALAGMLCLAFLWRDRRLPWRGLFLFGLIVLPWIGFASGYFGSPVPNSLWAKLVVYGYLAHGRLPNVVRLAASLGTVGWIMAGGWVLLGIRMAQGLRRGKESSDSSELLLIAPFLWMAIYYAAMAFSKVFLFGWYFAPPTPIGYLLGCIGYAPVLSRLLTRAADGRPFRRRVRALALALLAVYAALGFRAAAQTLFADEAVQRTVLQPIGIWLRAHSRPEETVMLEPIGIIGYFGEMRVLDKVGLVSPEVLPYYRRGAPDPMHALWQRFRPDWILLRAGEWTALTRLESKLQEANRISQYYTSERTWHDRRTGQPLFVLLHRKSGP
jgi:hypothetical protein